jgi:hypothetical protein
MTRKSIYEWYCAVVCILSIGAFTIFAGKGLLYTYYFYNPESGLNPIYQLDYKSPYPPLKLPPEFVVEQTKEEMLDEKKQRYESDLIQYEYDVSHVLRQNLIYSIFIIFIFIGHFKFLRNAKV